MKLANKVIIVTGGSGLLGSHFVKYLKNENAIVINADASEPIDDKENYHHCQFAQGNKDKNNLFDCDLLDVAHALDLNYIN